MPFALPALADIAFAVLAVLVCIAIWIVFKAVAAAMPDWPIIGSAIRDWLNGAASAVLSWMIATTKSSWIWLYNTFLNHAWSFTYIIEWAYRALETYAGMIHYLFDTVIPDAENRALNYAAGIVLAEIARAEAAENDISGTLANVEWALVGNIEYLQNTTVPHLIADAVAGVEADLSADAQALQRNIDSLSGDVTSALASVWATLTPLQTAVTIGLPAAIAEQAAQDKAALASAQAEDQAQLQATATSLSDQLASAKAELQAEQQAATAGLQAQLAQVQTQLQGQIAAASAAQAALSAADLTTAEGVAAADAASAAEATANAQAAALSQQVTSLQDQITATAAGTATALQTTVATLQGQLDQIGEQVEQGTATTTINLPQVGSQVEAGTITVPLAIGALGTAVADLTTEIDDCMVSTCDGPNNWQNLLGTLLQGAELASVIAFLAEIAKDPTGEARAVASVADDIYSAGHSLIDGLLSL